MDINTGRISTAKGRGTVADYDLDTGRLWSYITVYVYDAADMPDDTVVDLAEDAIERDGADMRAMGWNILADDSSVDSGPEEAEEDTRYCTYEVDHAASSVDVVATLLLGKVAPPFEFET